jgi:predicted NAD/FAD-binding protein
VAHFLRTLAFMPSIQGAGGVYFAGGWTFVAHEFALISGLAAAERLGAAYPFADDPQAEAVYKAYVEAVHGVKRG